MSDPLAGLDAAERAALSPRLIVIERRPGTRIHEIGVFLFGFGLIVVFAITVWRYLAVEPLPVYAPPTPTPAPTPTATAVPLMVGFLERCDLPYQGRACVVKYPSCEDPGILQTPGLVCVWRHQLDHAPHRPRR